MRVDSLHRAALASSEPPERWDGPGSRLPPPAGCPPTLGHGSGPQLGAGALLFAQTWTDWRQGGRASSDHCFGMVSSHLVRGCGRKKWGRLWLPRRLGLVGLQGIGWRVLRTTEAAPPGCPMGHGAALQVLTRTASHQDSEPVLEERCFAWVSLLCTYCPSDVVCTCPGKDSIQVFGILHCGPALCNKSIATSTENLDNPDQRKLASASGDGTAQKNSIFSVPLPSEEVRRGGEVSLGHVHCYLKTAFYWGPTDVNWTL